jgi:hypothetical protein
MVFDIQELVLSSLIIFFLALGIILLNIMLSQFGSSLAKTILTLSICFLYSSGVRFAVPLFNND